MSVAAAGGCNKRVTVAVRIERLRGSPQTLSSSSICCNSAAVSSMNLFSYRSVLASYCHACRSARRARHARRQVPIGASTLYTSAIFFSGRTKLYVLLGLGLGSDYYLNNGKKRRHFIAIECSWPCRTREGGTQGSGLVMTLQI